MDSIEVKSGVSKAGLGQMMGYSNENVVVLGILENIQRKWIILFPRGTERELIGRLSRQSDWESDKRHVGYFFHVMDHNYLINFAND